MSASIWPAVSASPKAGMMREKPRPRPPSVIVARQSRDQTAKKESGEEY